MRAKLLLLGAFSLTLFLTQCNKEEKASGLDKELLDESVVSTGFTYYRNNSSILASSPASAHKAFMRVKFNSIAQAALDSSGKLPAGASFPNGSLIVKELFDSQGGDVALYAIMKKDSTNDNSGANWLWAEIQPDENVLASVSKKGATCVNCHTANTRDHTRIFDILPDRELFEEATASTGFTYYKNNPAILSSSSASTHKPYMRVRFNNIAQSVLDSTGKLPSGSSFPNGSMIVKELYDNESGPLTLYAIMKKDSFDSDAGANWLWAEIEPNANVYYSVSQKGSVCTGCHNQASNDYTRVFDLF